MSFEGLCVSFEGCYVSYKLCDTQNPIRHSGRDLHVKRFSRYSQFLGNSNAMHGFLLLIILQSDWNDLKSLMKSS